MYRGWLLSNVVAFHRFFHAQVDGFSGIAALVVVNFGVAAGDLDFCNLSMGDSKEKQSYYK